MCALQNSSGGWIIVGVSLDPTGELVFTGLDRNVISLFVECVECDVIKVFDRPCKILAAHVNELSARYKPSILDSKVYRRIEGVNIISGKLARSILAREHDDEPYYDEENILLDEQSIHQFRVLLEQYSDLPRREFMNKSLIYSGKHLTRSGALMFGNILDIMADLDNGSKLRASNIWRANAAIIPRVTAGLSGPCSLAVKAMIINALLNADYVIDNQINITSKSGHIAVTNPGMISDTVHDRRLEAIFGLAGMKHDIRTILDYAPDFRLTQDLAAFRVRAELELATLPMPRLL